MLLALIVMTVCLMPTAWFVTELIGGGPLVGILTLIGLNYFWIFAEMQWLPRCLSLLSSETLSENERHYASKARVVAIIVAGAVMIGYQSYYVDAGVLNVMGTGQISLLCIALFYILKGEPTSNIGQNIG